MNWIIGMVLVIALTVVVYALYCAVIVTGRSDDENNIEDNIEADDEMFWKKKICPRCKTGKDSYDLDKQSETCPYIGCWKRNKCHFNEPLDESSKTGLFKRNKIRERGPLLEKFEPCAAI